MTGVWYNFSIPNVFQVPGLYRKLLQNTWSMGGGGGWGGGGHSQGAPLDILE